MAPNDLSWIFDSKPRERQKNEQKCEIVAEVFQGPAIVVHKTSALCHASSSRNQREFEAGLTQKPIFSPGAQAPQKNKGSYRAALMVGETF